MRGGRGGLDKWWQSAAIGPDSNQGSVRRGGLYISRKVDGDQEAIRPVVGKFVAIPFEGFVLALPHTKAVVGFRAPAFQVVRDNFVVGIISVDALKRDLALAVVHLGVGHTGFRIHAP